MSGRAACTLQPNSVSAVSLNLVGAVRRFVRRREFRMKITNDAMVSFDYVLQDDRGTVLDTSEGKKPLSYLHGRGQIVPGLEEALQGKQVGDEFQIQIESSEGYGERNEALRWEAPRHEFDAIEDLCEGTILRVDTDSGDMTVTVTRITEEVVTIDGNHPLAGMALNFSIVVKAVREATAEEIAEGQAGMD